MKIALISAAIILLAFTNVTSKSGIWVYCWSDKIQDYANRGQFNTVTQAEEYIKGLDCYIVENNDRLEE